MKKTNLQVLIENRAASSGNSLDEQACELLKCEGCLHYKVLHYPYACCYGLFNDMFSTDQDGTDPLGCSGNGVE